MAPCAEGCRRRRANVTHVTRFVTWAPLGTAAVLLGLAASFTHPFTGPADTVVAVGILAVLSIVAVQRWQSDPPALLARRAPIPLAIADGGGPGWRWLVPAAPLVALLGWEAFTYASSPRSAHPTLSVLMDGTDRSPFGHAAMVAGWLVLGWYLVTR